MPCRLHQGTSSFFDPHTSLQSAVPHKQNNATNHQRNTHIFQPVRKSPQTWLLLCMNTKLSQKMLHSRCTFTETYSEGRRPKKHFPLDFHSAPWIAPPSLKQNETKCGTYRSAMTTADAGHLRTGSRGCMPRETYESTRRQRSELQKRTTRESSGQIEP